MAGGGRDGLMGKLFHPAMAPGRIGGLVADVLKKGEPREGWA